MTFRFTLIFTISLDKIAANKELKTAADVVLAEY